jgi:glycosyltransferase involved in cell wall biosynthesis
MACGCPVVSPHNSAMIEVVEGAGETVNTWNHQHWIDTINKVYADRNRYVEAGLKRVREQSWSTIINRLADYIAR